MTKPMNYILFICRAQLFHNGHLSILRQALAASEKVIIVLGSAKTAISPRDPFTAEQRQEMILGVIRDIAPEREKDLIFLPVRDYFDKPRWLADVRAQVGQHVTDSDRVGIMGYHKDKSSDYLDDFPEWPLFEVEFYRFLNATDVRNFWFFGQGNSLYLLNCIPESIKRYLVEFEKTPTFKWLYDEYVAIEAYKHSWSTAPFEPTLLTTDAVITYGDYVLLIQRKKSPGKGRLALPGGFLERGERINPEASLRELDEETQIKMRKAALLKYFKAQYCADHPRRSLLGRVITNAFWFDIPVKDYPLPVVEGADDAEAAMWVHKSKLIELESRFHDDHFMILDHFLGILPR
jgi:bifunctional NMN adenylyltransferase/nudix hydrolase